MTKIVWGKLDFTSIFSANKDPIDKENSIGEVRRSKIQVCMFKDSIESLFKFVCLRTQLNLFQDLIKFIEGLAARKIIFLRSI